MWWFRPSAGTTNFGDELGPQIVTRLGYEVHRVPLEQADLVGCGSILGIVDAKAKPGTIVWGSGLIMPTDNMRAKRFNVKAVRGVISARRLGVEVPLGDPGILVPLLWPRKVNPRHRIGVIPHYVDKNRYAWADKVINPKSPVDQVIEEIQSCHTIASSSLHGLIIAEAYGIPAVRLYHPKVVGDEFKWVDYMSAFAGTSMSEAQRGLIRALES
jgi:pyruvyltransferase